MIEKGKLDCEMADFKETNNDGGSNSTETDHEKSVKINNES